jgi:AraC-like DNA-binding protein
MGTPERGKVSKDFSRAVLNLHEEEPLTRADGLSRRQPRGNWVDPSLGVEWINYRGPRDGMPCSVLPLDYAIAFLDGGYDLWTRGKLRAVTPGVYCAQPGELVVFRGMGEAFTTARALNVSLELMKQTAIECGFSKPDLVFRDFMIGKQPLRAPYDCVWHAMSGGSTLALQSALFELLGKILETCCESSPPRAAPPSAHALGRARDLIHSHSDSEVTLDELAAQSGLAKTYFVRAFRKRFGLPPHSYLMHVRLERARRLLGRGWRPIDVAAEVGFYDQSHLNRWFMRVMRVSPLAYAKATGKSGASR